MTTQADLERIALQESTLQFETFDAEIAWELGSKLRAAAVAKQVSVAIDIEFAGAPLFYHAMPGATPNNAEWIRRKKNVVRRFHQASYAVGLQFRRDNNTLQEQAGAPLKDYATAGGCFPLRLRGSEPLLGMVTVSGLPERQDHQLVVRTLAEMLGIDPSTVVLQEQ